MSERVAQRVWVVTARDAEGLASAVKGCVNGVEAPQDREQEDDVGQEVAREGATGEHDALPRVLDGEPRGGLRSCDEGNKVVGDVGSGEGVGALHEGEKVVGELVVVANGSGEAERMRRSGWNRIGELVRHCRTRP